MLTVPATITVVSAAAVIVATALWSAGTIAAPSCTPPRYVVGQFDIGGPELRAVALAISPKDFTRENLRCLLSTLKQRYVHPEAVSFVIFARWVAEHLKTWRFEPGSRGNPIDIRVTAAVDTAVSAVLAIDVD